MRTFIHTSCTALIIIGVLVSCGNNRNHPGKNDKDSLAPDTGSTQQGKKEIPQADKEFAKAAAEGGLFEVMLGELALQKATTTSVKELGQMMFDDHTRLNTELKDLAAKKDIMLPEKLGEEKQKIYDDLKNKKGNEFDKAYASLMVEDHIKDIEHFQEEAGNGEDTELRDWAMNSLPTLEHHLDMAKQTNKKLK